MTTTTTAADLREGDRLYDRLGASIHPAFAWLPILAVEHRLDRVIVRTADGKRAAVTAGEVYFGTAVSVGAA